MKKNKSDFEADYIIIGSGLGGLCTAAYLSQAKYRVIVLEKNSEIGGRCSTRIIDGNRFVIGANTFGDRTSFILNKLGIKIKWIPASTEIYREKSKLHFPISFSTIKELNTFGINVPTLLRTFYKLLKAFHSNKEFTSYSEFVNCITNSFTLKELLFLEAWYIGAHPDWLTASSFKLFLGTYYGYNKPKYPIEGAQAIPKALQKYIQINNGMILTNYNVSNIAVENGRAQYVQVGNEWFHAKKAVISNAEITKTIAMLNEQYSAKDILTNIKSALPLALLLITLDVKKAPLSISRPTLSTSTNTTIITRSICEIIDELNSGNLFDFPIINLVLSDLKAQTLNKNNLQILPVHVSVLWPTSLKNKIDLSKITQSILIEIDKKYPGFQESVLSSNWITPEEYFKKFGFSSNPAPVLESPNYTKHSWKLPISGLFNVGTTVQPSGSHAGCAFESGYNCAKYILNNL